LYQEGRRTINLAALNDEGQRTQTLAESRLRR
jgi:hypothetical protein